MHQERNQNFIVRVIMQNNLQRYEKRILVMKKISYGHCHVVKSSNQQVENQDLRLSNRGMIDLFSSKCLESNLSRF